jgi:hypothetical protein
MFGFRGVNKEIILDMVAIWAENEAGCKRKKAISYFTTKFVAPSSLDPSDIHNLISLTLT